MLCISSTSNDSQPCSRRLYKTFSVALGEGISGMTTNGEWKDAADSSGRVYYYNVKTGESRWDKPPELYNEQELELQKHSWKTAKTPEGKLYYYNADTGESRWEVPRFDDNTESKEGKHRLQEEDQNENETSSHKISSGDSKYLNNSKILNPPKSSKEEAEKKFVEMLQENQVDSTWSFRKIISHLGATDPRYWMVDDDPLWKQQIFEKYLTNRSEDQLLKEHTETNKFKEAFWQMLKSKPQIVYYTRWSTAKMLIANEPIYKHSVVREAVKKRSFQEYIAKLLEEHMESEKQLKDRALKELREYLESIIFIDPSHLKDGQLPIMSWQHLLNNYLFDKNKRFLANKHFKVLTHEDVLKVYFQSIDAVENSLHHKWAILEASNYTKDRIARDNFKELLRSQDLRIRANTKWKEVYPIFKNDPRFLRMLGTNGSSALDLFLDFVEEKAITIAAHRSIAQTLLIEKGFQWRDDHDDMNRDLITKLLAGDAGFQSIEREDIQLIVDQLLDLRKEKLRQQLEVEQRIWDQKIHFFKMMLQRFYRGTRAKPDSWEIGREELKDSTEFKELGDNEEVRKKIFDEFKSDTSATTARLISGVPKVSKKRPLTPTLELDY